jgi:predicted  nucleic acid-binding Zn-ribbon protein
LSALTKILIVLLSLLSVYLCSSVVIYVSTATNYKKAYEDLRTELAASKEKNKSFEQQLEEKNRQMTEHSDKLDAEIASLKVDKSKIEQDLKNAERDKLALDEKVQNLAAAALKFEQTVGGMEGSLKETRAELDKARVEGVKLSKNLNEITASLEEKIAQLESLNAEKKRLLEEKARLENQISGKSPVEATEPITVVPDSAKKAIEPTAGSALQGKITAIEGNLVTLSIGTADGVEKGMIFHVTRNDAFICDIKITEVDTENSAGTLQLVQQPPQAGDVASTTW